MGRGDACDARCQAFNKEVVRNENKGRMQWFITNRERMLENLEKADPKLMGQLQKLKSKCEPLTPKPAEAKVKISVPSSARKEEVILSPFMKPVEPALLKIFYDKEEVSHEARKKYLKERYKLPPEDKFHTIDCTNWLYGWKIKHFQTKPPDTHNRKPVIRTTFYRKNLSSIKNDDRPMRKCQVTDAKNFKAINEY